MKVLLIRPPRRHPLEQSLTVPPLGLAYIASSLENAGHQVEIWDAYIERWTWSKLRRRLAEISVDVIGFSAMTPMWDVICKASEMAQHSARWQIVGGPHPTAVKHEIFAEAPLLDAGVVGEGEEVVVELMQWFDKGGRIPKGVLVPNKPFEKASPPQISSIAKPARYLLDNQKYRYPLAGQRNIGTMITSRGCPFRCSFCDKSVSGSTWRARTAKDVVDEMESMQQEFGIQFINMYDDNFTLHRKRVMDICEEIVRRGLKMSWKCEGRVDNLDDALLQAMKNAGCTMIAFGVESGNADSLALLRKDIDIEQTEQTFRLMQAVGVKSLAYMILGVPGETLEDVWTSIRFAKDIGADYVQFSSLSAMPGTPLSMQFDSGASVRNFLDADVERKTLTSLDEETLQRAMRQAWRYFYVRPKPLWRLSRDIVRSGYVFELGKGVLQALRDEDHHVRSNSFWRASEA
jgi:anaerobic magnesium-protoporphyrin IX monomethyl ester cyclase